MPQKHPEQQGTFHVTTATHGHANTLTRSGIPERLLHHLCDTRSMQDAKLYTFCILPSHIHLLFSPGPKGLSAFMHAFKKNSSRDIPELLWQKGFYDERIRDSKQRSAAIHYIQGNAMKHHLTKDVTDWPWSSLQFPQMLDPMEVWL